MDTIAILSSLREEMHSELVEHLLPFWLDHALDEQNGGFVGRVDADGIPDFHAPKGGILNTRILWTFAAAYRVLGDERYADVARRAFEELETRFWDKDHGGVYWMVDADGALIDDRKHVYAQAFAIYGYSEYYRATGDAAALERSVELFRLVETITSDEVNGGYIEAFSREWKALDDARLSEKDDDVAKSTNTHLHLIEAYSNLLRCRPDQAVRDALSHLVEIFLTRVYDADRHACIPFFDDDWTPRSSVVSFGHDIETSWLLTDAADLLPDVELNSRVRDVALDLVRNVIRLGIDVDGGVMYTAGDGGIFDSDKHWWPQAEAIVGLLNAWEICHDVELLSDAARIWSFTKRAIIDKRVGEWHERVNRSGAPYPGEARIHEWKCPYHNTRACLEVLMRTEALVAAPTTMNGR